MFEISFGELILVAAIALVVIGPDHIPSFAKSLGKWIAKIKKLMDDTRSEVIRELEMPEILKVKTIDIGKVKDNDQ